MMSAAASMAIKILNKNGRASRLSICLDIKNAPNTEVGRQKNIVFLDYQYIGHYKEIHEENELFHVG